MNTSSAQIIGLLGFPTIGDGDDLIQPILNCTAGGTQIVDGDILVIASKVVSLQEKRRVQLSEVSPSNAAVELADQLQKDARLVELILRESKSYRLATPRGPLIAWHHHGYELTSAGVDRAEDGESAILLPVDPDSSANELRSRITEQTGRTIAVIIADSDGRPDRRGATVVAIGSSGIAPLRVTTTGKKRQEETLVDLISAAAGIVIGQRGRGVPIAIVRGVQYTRDDDSGVSSILQGHR